MEFNNLYPTSITMEPPSSPYSLPYASVHSYYTLSSYSQPSQSAAVYEQENHDVGVLDALTEGLSANSGDALDRFLGGKRQFAAKSVEEILSIIYDRERIRYDQSRRIDYESTKVNERLMEIGPWRTGLNPQIDKTRGQLQREILTLERERRMEEVACWRDITRLKGDLREALRVFDQEKRKEHLITHDGSP